MPRLACARSCASVPAPLSRLPFFSHSALWVQLQRILSEVGYQPNRPFDVGTVKEEILTFAWDRKLYALPYPLGRIDRAPWLQPNYDFSSEHILGRHADSRSFDALGGSRMVALAHLVAFVESGGTAGLDTETAIALAIENAQHVFPAFTVIFPPPPSGVGEIYVCVLCARARACVCVSARAFSRLRCLRARIGVRLCAGSHELLHPGGSCACLCVRMCVRSCARAHVRVRVRFRACVFCVCVFVRACAHLCVTVCVCACVRVCACACVCVLYSRAHVRARCFVCMLPDCV